MAVPHDQPVPVAGQPAFLATDEELAEHAADTDLHGGGAAVAAHEAAADPHAAYLQEAAHTEAQHIGLGLATSAEVDADVVAHEGAADPHPGYVREADHTLAAHDTLGLATQAELDARVGEALVIRADFSNPPTEFEIENAVGSLPAAVKGLPHLLTDTSTERQYLALSDGVRFIVAPLPTTPDHEIITLTAAPSGSGGSGRAQATYYNGKTYFAYTNGTNGDKCVRSYDHATGTVSAETVLAAALDDDPVHSEPTLLIRDSDKRIMVAYSVQDGAAMYLRVSTNPEDISSFAAAVDLDAQLGGSDYTYPHLIQLTGLANDPIFLIARMSPGGGGQGFHYSTSTDGGSTWSAAVNFFAEPIDFGYIGATKTSESRIDFTATKVLNTGAAPPTHLYHCYFDGTSFYKTDGTVTAPLPLELSDLTLVYNATADNSQSSVSYVALRNGNPACLNAAVFADTTIHALYHYWDGAAWNTVELCDDNKDVTTGGGAGGTLLDADSALIPRDVSGVNQMFLFRTADDGATWTNEQITSGSTNHFRPAPVVNAARDLLAVWGTGDSSGPPAFNAGTAGVGADDAGASSVNHLTRIVSIAGTQSELESLTGTRSEALVGVASDSGQIGVYSGGAWTWATSGGGYTEGAAFPGSPASGDKFFHTGYQMLFYYDGTRWLSENLFTLGLSGGASDVNNLSATAAAARVPVPTDVDIYVVDMYALTQVATTNTGANFWKFDLYKRGATGAGTVIGTYSTGTAPDTAGNFVNSKTAINAVIDNATDRYLYLEAVKSGTPGNLYGNAYVTYRVIGA